MTNIVETGAGDGSPEDGETPSGEGNPRVLLTWFEGVRRALPWRSDDPDPYRIAVSEVMLQQTRVETVRPRFEAFLARFPTVEALAAAAESEVLAAWSGLGYYRRARNLRSAAREVVARGAWPTASSGLRELPGFGEYTAAAVASIAFGEAVPVVDGNVERVFARRLALPAPVKRAASRRALRAAAAEWISPDKPGESNQALMELGSLVCTPRSPNCGRCPLRSGCRAAAEGDPERYPVRAAKRAPVAVGITTLVVVERGRFLLFRRHEGESLLAGLWETPWVENHGDRGAVERRLERRYGGRWSLGEETGRVVHSITHRRLEVEVRRGRLVEPGSVVRDGAEAGWFRPEEIDDLPVSSLVTKVLGLATPGSRPGRPPG